jgi:cytochrome c oxidase cbb3-type subunit 3
MTNTTFPVTSFLRFTFAISIFLAVTISFVYTQAHGANQQDRQNQAASASSSDGRKVFETTCAACHGLDGRGGERGPNIVTRQEVLRRSDAELLHLLQEGLPESGMPPFESLGAARLKSVLAHLRSLQGASRAASLPGNPQNGKVLFSGKARCTECHMVSGRGGFLGSDLTSYAASRSAEDMREAVIQPNKYLDPKLRTIVATTRNGHKFTGIARNEDNFSLQLQTADGAFHLFNKADLEHLEYQPTSLMPADYGTTLSPAELDDLISYLANAAITSKQNGDLAKAWEDENDD